MMSITHSVVAAAGVSLILTTANPLHLAVGIVGSQLPDIDTSTSHIGQIFFPLSRWIEARYPHRSITHSLLAAAAIAVVSSPIYFCTGDLNLWISLWLGHLLSIFSDVFTKEGVQLFWPAPYWGISVSNPNRRFETGKAGELWVLFFASLALIGGISLANRGGAAIAVGSSLGLQSTINRQYNEAAGSHHVWANIDGVRASDRTSLSGKFWVVGADGNEYIVTADGQHLYKTGSQLISSMLTIESGTAAKTKALAINFDDEDVVTTLNALSNAYPQSAIFLTGELTIDAPEEVTISSNPHHYQSIAKSETGTIKLSFNPLDQALKHLNNQYATGTVIAKVITPKPIFSGVRSPQSNPA